MSIKPNKTVACDTWYIFSSSFKSKRFGLQETLQAVGPCQVQVWTTKAAGCDPVQTRRWALELVNNTQNPKFKTQEPMLMVRMSRRNSKPSQKNSQLVRAVCLSWKNWVRWRSRLWNSQKVTSHLGVQISQRLEITPKNIKTHSWWYTLSQMSRFFVPTLRFVSMSWGSNSPGVAV